MRSLAIIAIILGLLLSMTGASRRVDATPQLLPGILKKMETARTNLKSLRAAIVQEKHNVQIDVSDVDSGTMIYKLGMKGDMRARIDYTKPDTQVVSLIGDQGILYQPRINQVTKASISKLSKGRGGYAWLAGLLGSVNSLAKDYSFDYVKDEAINGQQTSQLHLLPKSKSDVTSLDIWVSQNTWLPVQQKAVERNGDYTLVKLSNMELNIKLADEAFNVKYPSGTSVVQR